MWFFYSDTIRSFGFNICFAGLSVGQKERSSVSSADLLKPEPGGVFCVKGVGVGEHKVTAFFPPTEWATLFIALMLRDSIQKSTLLHCEDAAAENK